MRALVEEPAHSRRGSRPATASWPWTGCLGGHAPLARLTKEKEQQGDGSFSPRPVEGCNLSFGNPVDVG